MSEITLQFVYEAGDIGSELIGWFSAGDPSHALSHVDAIWDNGTLLGARSDNPGGHGTGVQVRPADYMQFSRRVRMTIPVTDEQFASWHQFLEHQIGKPYDEEAIAAFVFSRDWRAEGHWFCSELQGRGLEVPGIFLRLYTPCNKLVPETLATTISAFPGVKVEIP